ncbi:cell division cycle-associated protein 3 isoform X1 [Carettochelys insculpta]|uniref:cell division cycle-associated protein 3 isoform X1 n=1 Tax=Carettochelys insculpta TaxID=44489 RepID=UPI003EBAD4FE
MGAAESFPATPASKPFLKHLAHVRDPRSPTPGILRTPIEVESSPQRSPLAEPKEAEMASGQSWDPRSPTLGISRTPMKAVMPAISNPWHGCRFSWSHEQELISARSFPMSLGACSKLYSMWISKRPANATNHHLKDTMVKQLSEDFGAETLDQESLLEEPLDQGQNLGAAYAPGEETIGKTHQVEGSNRDASQEKIPVWREEKEMQPLSSICAQPVMKSSCFIDHPRTSGGKPTRRKATNKALGVSGSTGRSPLSILQDDNSPSTLVPRQSKRFPLQAENLGEWKEVAADPGSCAWNDLNKENQHCRLLEN